MKKVVVLGCGGSGKSYVARSLGNLLDSPAIHLDAVSSTHAAPRDHVGRSVHSTVTDQLERCDVVDLTQEQARNVVAPDPALSDDRHLI